MKKKILAAAALAVASVGAQANPPVEPGDLGAIDNLPLSIGNVVAPGLLFDVFSFTLNDSGMLSGTAVSLNVPSSLGLSPFEVRLQDSSFAIKGSDNNPSDGFSFSGLAAGHYALTFVGLATGTRGGSYGGAILAETGGSPPIPEPGSYAMMLAGLAAVGFVVARRRARF
jgi:hypothetical protein